MYNDALDRVIRWNECVARYTEWCVWKECHSGTPLLYCAWRGGQQGRFGSERPLPAKISASSWRAIRASSLNLRLGLKLLICMALNLWGIIAVIHTT